MEMETGRGKTEEKCVHTQMTFDWLLFDEPCQMCCDILSLLFRKDTMIHVQNSDAQAKFLLIGDTHAQIHLSVALTSAPTKQVQTLIDHCSGTRIHTVLY